MTQQLRPRARLSLFIASGAIGALLLAGCSAGGGDESGSAGSGNEEFSLAFAVTDSATNPYETLAQQYMDENPNVKITINKIPNDTYAQTLTTQLNAGNASDVFQTTPGSGSGSSVVALAEANLLEPLGEHAAELIPAGSEGAFQYEDQTYGVPLSATFAGTLENATAIEESGLAIPDNFEDLLDTCVDARQSGKSLLSLAATAIPNAAFLATTISATRVYASEPDWNEQRAAGDVTFADSEGWQATLQAVLDMNDAGCFQDGAEGAGFDGLINAVVTGSAMAMVAPSGGYVTLEGLAPESEFTVGVFPPPTAGDDAFGFLSPNYALSMAANSKNKDAATAFSEWMAEPEQSATFAEAQGSLPVSGVADADLSGTAYAAVADLIQNGDYAPIPTEAWPNASVNDALGTGVQGLITGQKSIADVLTAMDQAWDN